MFTFCAEIGFDSQKISLYKDLISYQSGFYAKNRIYSSQVKQERIIIGYSQFTGSLEGPNKQVELSIMTPEATRITGPLKELLPVLQSEDHRDAMSATTRRLPYLL